MQVPVVMTTPLGQKIAPVAVPSANSSSTGIPAVTGSSAPKVLIQTVPTSNSDKITLQLAKIITITPITLTLPPGTGPTLPHAQSPAPAPATLPVQLHIQSKADGQTTHSQPKPVSQNVEATIAYVQS